MDKKVIFIDVDGTLTSTEKEVSKLNKEAISQARKNGHLVFICTGRNLCSINQEIKDIGFDGIICSAGSRVEVDGEEIHSSYIPHDKVVEIQELFTSNKMEYALEATKHTYMSTKMAEYFLGDITQKENSEKSRLINAINDSFNTLPIEQYTKEHVHKISFIALDEESLKQPKELLEKDFFFVIHHLSVTTTINGEIILKQSNKATGIQHVLNHIKRSLEDTIGIGDSMNDYQMIEYVNYGVAMENACQELKDISDKIARDVTDDAIYHLFIELGII